MFITLQELIKDTPSSCERVKGYQKSLFIYNYFVCGFQSICTRTLTAVTSTALIPFLLFQTKHRYIYRYIFKTCFACRFFFNPSLCKCAFSVLINIPTI